MADASEPEGWRVPQRKPMIAAATIPVVLLLVLLIAGHFYDRRLRAGHFRSVATFPAPGIETYVHDGQGDPPRPRPAKTPDRAIDAAKRAVVADGIGNWR